jgi:NAD(P)-dependent dehydrogenase (short-subunit alcohol dehydrogenase family)
MSANEPLVFLVTGASSGIGRACAVHLARQGHRVFGTTRRPPDAVAADLHGSLENPEPLDVLAMDVDAEASVVHALEHVVERTGRLDVVVNCAGFGIGGAIEDMSDQDAWDILQTNLMGSLRVCRAALPSMRAQGSGMLINISSIGGRMGLPFQGLYSATKYAIEGLTEALRMEVRPFGIRATLIEPGDFCTGFTDNRRVVTGTASDDVYRSAREHALSVVERDERGGGTPDIVARLVERIASKRSPRVRYVVGPVAERLAATLKRVLPSKWFEWVLSIYYGMTK